MRCKQALQREAALAGRLGFDHRWIEGDELHGHIHSDSFRGGVFDPHPLILNPARLARGLKSAVERLGVRVYEQTPLEELCDGEPLRVRTSRGSVRARVAVLAANGYSGALGFMPQRIIPAHTYIVLTEPMSDAQLDSIGWRQRRTSLETARNLIHYFRLTADNRVAFGGEDAKLFVARRVPGHGSADVRATRGPLSRVFSAAGRGAVHSRLGRRVGRDVDMFPTFVRGAITRASFTPAGTRATACR